MVRSKKQRRLKKVFVARAQRKQNRQVQPRAAKNRGTRVEHRVELFDGCEADIHQFGRRDRTLSLGMTWRIIYSDASGP